MPKGRLFNDYFRYATMTRKIYNTPATHTLPLGSVVTLCVSPEQVEVISIGGTGNPAHGR